MQYVKGRVMDQNGNHLLFIFVKAVISGAVNTVQTVQTEGDGTFTFWIAGGPPGTTNISESNCPGFSVRYDIAVYNPQGAQDSDVRAVKYEGNCNDKGEFHFDFVKVR